MAACEALVFGCSPWVAERTTRSIRGSIAHPWFAMLVKVIAFVGVVSIAIAVFAV
jgi:hypothetical protein